jgi:hypothetical protein
MIRPYLSVFLLGLLLLPACQQGEPRASDPPPVEKLFTAIPAAYSGIDFVNQLTYTEEFNPYTYRNFYNGAGVGLGDLNNDGLIDIYFCGNLEDNKLYLNEGDFRFRDVTAQAGVACPRVWSTGVSLADVNGDGWLDIYVCKSGDPKGENRHNELFINSGKLDEKGVPTFTEQAEAYGIADKGLSSHAAFFDYDRDGDLDCYLLNNSFRPVGKYDLQKNQREIRDPLGGNKLYRLDGEKYTDVSEEAGIYGSVIGFGLGVTVGDLNRDGWPDIFVSNDFFERDYLYLNQQDGTFKECLETYIRETAMGAMGADLADLNNDGYPEIFVTDMLPEDDARMKTKTNFENWDKYQINLRQGYYHQFTRNVLQLNMGPSPDPKDPGVYFSEVGRLAGVNATDWSWGALIFDMDNDGMKDIFVANGIYKDLTDQDYINFYSPSKVREVLFEEKGGISALIEAMPSQALPNYAFQNQGRLRFENQAQAWGLDAPSFSNGSAYGDLDNDGDLDLVTNNVNMPPFLYRNNTDSLQADNHYLQIELKGSGKNPFGLGAQVTAYLPDRSLFIEQNNMRGFQSTVDHRLHLGLGPHEQIDSLRVNWPDGRSQTLRQVAADQKLLLRQEEASLSPALSPPSSPPLFKEQNLDLAYKHQENPFKDFSRDRLLFHMLSAEGPKVAVGDVNGDGRDDFYVCGAKDQAGSLFIQKRNGTFKTRDEKLFEEDQVSEDVDALFFDADGDGDLDLYVASGGNEFPPSSSALLDRLYLNRGRGRFSKSPQLLPVSRYESSSCVEAADFDRDGDLDLFVGVRLRPFLYGVPVNGYLLENDGKGTFRDVTAEKAPALQKLGMITDGLWLDYDQDRDLDLVVVGEWMPITVLENQAGQLVDVSERAGLSQTHGFWNCLQAGDVDKDGDLDLLVGNHGQNTRIRVSPEKPASLYVNDFDGNGKAEQMIFVYNGPEAYPLALKPELVMQMPVLKKKYLKHENYQEQKAEDIFSTAQLEKAVKQTAAHNETALLINDGKGGFSLKPLPIEAQFSPTYGLLIRDFDKDGNPDILLAGNFHRAKPEIGMYDANYGLFLKGDGKGDFTPTRPGVSGFFVMGEVRELESLRVGNRNLVLVAKNNDRLQFFEY